MHQWLDEGFTKLLNVEAGIKIQRWQTFYHYEKILHVISFYVCEATARINATIGYFPERSIDQSVF